MSDFGCFYNPRPSPGRCIKDTRSTNVEAKCEISNGTCRLRSDQPEIKSEIKPEIKYIPTAASKTLSTLSLQDLTKNDPTNSTLSGPISAYSGELNGGKILLFGDAHFSLANECPAPCKSFENNRNINPAGAATCWNLARLYSDIFTQAEKKGEWVDFYLEIPFTPKDGYKPKAEDINVSIDSYGELYKIYYTFYTCFHKYNCSFKNVRFHYSDVRLEYVKAEYNEMMSMLNKMMNRPDQAFTIKPATFQGYVFERIMKSLDRLGDIFESNTRNPDIFIEDTDKIMKALYYSGGQTMTGTVEPLNEKLFKTYLFSDNYIDDVQVLLEPLILEIVDDRTKLEVIMSVIMPKTAVNRRGKNMHRSRAQLEALEQEGNTQLSDKLKSYIMDRYIKLVDNSGLIDIWSRFMSAYNNFVRGRSRQLGDEKGALNKLVTDYKKYTELLSSNVSGNSLLMDVYILGRMFRQYPGKKHINSKTKIVFAGDAHIDTYVDFLSTQMNVPFYSYGNNVKGGGTESYNRCLDINIDRFL